MRKGEEEGREKGRKRGIKGVRGEEKIIVIIYVKK